MVCCYNYSSISPPGILGVPYICNLIQTFLSRWLGLLHILIYLSSHLFNFSTFEKSSVQSAQKVVTDPNYVTFYFDFGLSKHTGFLLRRFGSAQPENHNDIQKQLSSCLTHLHKSQSWSDHHQVQIRRPFGLR